LLKKGELILLDTLSYPNGISLSPDGSRLYVAVSDPEHAVWYQYNIESPGVASNKKIFYDVTPVVNKEGHRGLPDGLAVNGKGYIFATGPGGVWIFNKEAKPLARILTGQLTSNCALGKNEKQLFMTADDYILSLNLK
jgi:gluconolactonase